MAVKRRRRRSAGFARIGGRNLMGQLKEAGIEAAGFIGAELAVSRLPLPAALTRTPVARSLTTIGLGIAAGALLPRLVGGSIGGGIARGMVLNGVVRIIATYMPGANTVQGLGRVSYEPFVSNAPLDVAAAINAMNGRQFDEMTGHLRGLAGNPFVGAAGAAIDEDVLRLVS